METDGMQLQPIRKADVLTFEATSEAEALQRLDMGNGDQYIPPLSQQCGHNSASRKLPPIDGGFRAWTFLASAFLMELLCLGGAFSFSIFQDYLVKSSQSPRKGTTNVEASIIGTLLVSSTYFAPAIMRGVWARFAHRNQLMSFACLQLAGVSLLIASFETSLPVLVIFMGLIPGTTLGLGTINYLIWLPQWFSKRRGLANGIAFAGAGTGGIVYPFMLNASLHHLGFSWTLRIWAFVIMSGGGVLSYFIRSRLPTTKATPSGLPWSSQPRQSTDTGSPSRARARSKEGWRKWRDALSFMLSPLWLIQAFSTLFASMGFFSVSFYLAVYCTNLGLSRSTSTGIVAAFNGAALTGEIMVGYACDRYAYPGIILVIGVIGALSALLLLGLVQSLVGLVFFVLLFGMAAGSYCSTWSAAAYDVSRLKGMQTANVILSFTFVRGLASIIGPLVAAALYHPQKTQAKVGFGALGFEGLIIFVGACMVALALCSPLLTYLRRKAFCVKFARAALRRFVHSTPATAMHNDISSYDKRHFGQRQDVDVCKIRRILERSPRLTASLHCREPHVRNETSTYTSA
ncbi:hypothetical protein CBS101457_002979 [Exobasidium rhododendri]|nr:hypothetical protein CBS101457_002979 [Exobasidium rhododendri]